MLPVYCLYITLSDAAHYNYCLDFDILRNELDSKAKQIEEV